MLRLPHLLAATSLTCLFATAHAGPGKEILDSLSLSQKDNLPSALYWHPATRDAMRSKIPNHHEWVGFEPALWDALPETTRKEVISHVAKELDRKAPTQLDNLFQDLQRWNLINTQLRLLISFCDSQETFFELAHQDPSLRDAFKWITSRRPADFDTRHIGTTFSSGETAIFFPTLCLHILQLPQQEQLECFARLMGQISRIPR